MIHGLFMLVCMVGMTYLYHDTVVAFHKYVDLCSVFLFVCLFVCFKNILTPLQFFLGCLSMVALTHVLF